MPIYEYQCLECGHTIEILRFGGETAEENCPECGSGRLRRLFSPFAVGGASVSPTETPSASGSTCGCGSCSCQN